MFSPHPTFLALRGSMVFVPLIWSIARQTGFVPAHFPVPHNVANIQQSLNIIAETPDLQEFVFDYTDGMNTAAEVIVDGIVSRGTFVDDMQNFVLGGPPYGYRNAHFQEAVIGDVGTNPTRPLLDALASQLIMEPHLSKKQH